MEQSIKDLEEQFQGLTETAARLGLATDKVKLAYLDRLGDLKADYVKSFDTQLIDVCVVLTPPCAMRCR